MYIRSRTASLAFKVFIATIGTLTLLQQLGVFDLRLDINFVYFFTNISNIAVAAYFWCDIAAILRGRDAANPWAPKLKYMAMLGITVTFLVAHFMLDGGYVFQNGQFQLHMLIVHYIVPICTILDWLLFDKKGHIGWGDPLIWPAFPLAYLAYACFLVLGLGVRCFEDNRWPYPFLNVDVLGVPMVVGICIGLLLAFIVLGYGYAALDHALAKRSRE